MTHDQSTQLSCTCRNRQRKDSTATSSILTSSIPSTGIEWTHCGSRHLISRTSAGSNLRVTSGHQSIHGDALSNLLRINLVAFPSLIPVTKPLRASSNHTSSTLIYCTQYSPRLRNSPVLDPRHLKRESPQVQIVFDIYCTLLSPEVPPPRHRELSPHRALQTLVFDALLSLAPSVPVLHTLPAVGLALLSTATLRDRLPGRPLRIFPDLHVAR